MTFPVEKAIPEIKQALQNTGRAVLQAPPGAGKTTRVPLALLDESWLKNKKILLLEPRRLAAKTCASYMASILKQPLGRTVGYRIRMESKVSADTSIEVMTQGIFTRKIQTDPGLEDVGLVIFDEFHERNIHSDLGLALCMDALEAFCSELKILVMSATMDVKAVSSLMDDAPVIVSEGRQFDVKTIYSRMQDLKKQKSSVEINCAGKIRQALEETGEDILVFLPGAGEIRRVYSILEQELSSDIDLLPLYGNLTREQQEKVFLPSKAGNRKIVLSTSIAETSLTIDGIGVVVDSGLMRLPRFSPKTGMSRLETIPVSKAAADQRRGRAGRTAGGTCYRLWSEYDHGLLKPFTPPEILNADLCSLSLELAAWGVSDPGDLKWLNPPDSVSFDQARELLIFLGGLDNEYRITSHGRQMVRSGLHPRLAHMIIRAESRGLGDIACRIAALLEEQDIIQTDYRLHNPDFRLRLEILEDAINHKKGWQNRSGIKEKLVLKIIQTYRKIKKSFGIKQNQAGNGAVVEEPGRLLALAFPDRIARKRKKSDNNFLMASGKGAFFSHPNTLSSSEYIVALHLDGKEKNSKIFLAVPVLVNEIEEEFGYEFKTLNTVAWNDRLNAVQSKMETRFKKIVVKEKKLSEIDPEKGSAVFIEQIKKAGLQILPWTKKTLSFKARVQFLRKTDRFSSLPDLSDRALEKKLDTWLKPFLTDIFSFKNLAQMNFESAFFSMLTWDEKQLVEKNAPTHIVVPSGSKCPVQYSSQGVVIESPVLKVRLQEIFSMKATPEIAGVRMTVHILSPAQRPVQITDDLESFWKNTYKDVKKDLMGRYPKHYWPDDPFTAVPTNRVKPKNI